MALDPRLILAGTPHVIGVGELQQAQAQNQMLQLRALQIAEETRGVQARNALMDVMRSADPATGMPAPEALSRYSMQFPEEGMKLRSGLDQLQQQRALADFRKAETAKIQAAQADRLRNQSFDLVAVGVSAADAALKTNPDPAMAKDAGVKAMAKEIDNLEKLGGYSPDEINRLRAAAYNFDPIDDKAHLENRKSALARQKAEERASQPQSPVGKAEADYRAGLIDKPTRDALVRKETLFAREVPAAINVNVGGGAKGTTIGDDTKSGPEYLASLPKQTAELVKGIAEGRVSPTTLSTKGGHREQIMSAVLQYDPTYNATRPTTWREFTTGATAKNITSINTSLAHMDTMFDLANAMKNNDIRAANAVINRIATETGRPEVTNFELARQAVGDELMRTFRQVGASEQEAQAWQSRFASANSPEQLLGAIRTAGKLLEGRLAAINEQWKRGTQLETDFPNIVTPKNVKVLNKIGVPYKPNEGTTTAAPSTAAGGVAMPTSKAEYNALPSGARYRKPGDPETAVRVKP